MLVPTHKATRLLVRMQCSANRRCSAACDRARAEDKSAKDVRDERQTDNFARDDDSRRSQPAPHLATDIFRGRATVVVLANVRIMC
jgi:hypothetical protein